MTSRCAGLAGPVFASRAIGDISFKRPKSNRYQFPPIPIPDSELEMPIQMAVIALRTQVGSLVQSTTLNLKTTRKGYIAADCATTTPPLPPGLTHHNRMIGGFEEA
jgi:hypothetical protein